jgi:hypothetical protein
MLLASKRHRQSNTRPGWPLDRHLGHFDAVQRSLANVNASRDVRSSEHRHARHPGADSDDLARAIRRRHARRSALARVSRHHEIAMVERYGADADLHVVGPDVGRAAL